MKIVDAHAHIFPELQGFGPYGHLKSLGYGRVDLGNGKTEQMMPPLNEKLCHTTEMLLAHMDWSGVEMAILLQGPSYGKWNHYVADACRRYPHRFLGAAYFDPWEENSRENFNKIIKEDIFRAVKLECAEASGLCGIHPEAQLDDPEIGWLWDELERNRLVLVLDLGNVGSRSYQTEAVRKIAEEQPSLSIVIAHLAQPNPTVEKTPELWQLWQDQIKLGKLDNVWFDTSAIPYYLSQEDYPYPSANRYLRIAVDCIGAHKLMWGSDIPWLLSRANYPQLVRMAKLHTNYLSSEEQALILGKTALRIYGQGKG